MVLRLVHQLEDAKEAVGLDAPETEAKYWKAAQSELGTAIGLIQQGFDFLLKAQICEVSPYLLISRNPADWPKKCDKEDIEFAEFRTIDSQDFVKVLDTVSPTRFDPEFVTLFDDLRKRRNRIMHTIDPAFEANVKDILTTLLLGVEYLIGPRQWVRLRKENLEREVDLGYDGDPVSFVQVHDFSTVVDLLDPAVLLRCFGFDRKRRRYHCPSCCHVDDNVEMDVMTALLQPNTPISPNVYCFICTQDQIVERIDCNSSGCMGNVYSPDWDMCLTCKQSRA